VKIAVLGCGAMGSVYAGLLADAGHEVWAIDVWEEHVRAIRERGLRVDGASGDRVVRLPATTDAAEPGPVELVIVATKVRDVVAAAEAARPLLGPDTVVLAMQNGIGGPERLAEALGPERVAVGVAGGFGASIVAPGHVHHNGWELVRLGELEGPATERIERVADAWRSAGFRVQVYDDVRALVWEKLVCNAAFSGVCAITEMTIGEVLDHPDATAVSAACATEAWETARASGAEIGFDDPVAYTRAFGARIPDARPSMLLDILAGRPCEIDAINGAVPPAARAVGLVAPVNETVAALVRAKEAAIIAGPSAPG
jgi:2-dehydropantoate 2-reductase